MYAVEGDVVLTSICCEARYLLRIFNQTEQFRFVSVIVSAAPTPIKDKPIIIARERSYIALTCVVSLPETALSEHCDEAYFN